MQQIQLCESVLIEDNMSNDLLISFSSVISAYQNNNPFHFTRAVSGLNVNKIFLRDMTVTWYHQGLSGATGDIDETADYLRALVGDNQFDRVVTMGASSGGYAALLFGLLLDVDEVISIAPATFIDEAKRAQHGDARWPELFQNFGRIPRRQHKYYDLRDVFLNHKRPKGRYRIFYSEGDALDQLHADWMREFDFIEREAIGHLEHSGLILEMVHSGRLVDELYDAFYRGRYER